MHQSEPTHIRIHIYAYPTAIFLHQIFSTKNERESERREGGGQGRGGPEEMRRKRLERFG